MTTISKFKTKTEKIFVEDFLFWVEKVFFSPKLMTKLSFMGNAI